MAARLAFVALVLGFGVGCGTTANHQSAPIGSACSQNSDCGTPSYFCILPSTADGKTIDPDGYCSLPCVAATSDCPTDSICVVGQCRRSCSDGSACRVAEGYACVPGPAHGGQHDFCDDPNAL